MNVFLTCVREAMRRRERVTISGFGTFVVTRRAARNGRNPRTGREITIPPARVPRFRPSRVLKSLRYVELWYCVIVASRRRWGIV